MPFTRGSCCHDHECADEDCGASFSLYRHLDLSKVRCLNEAEPGSCREIFRPWETRSLGPDGSPGEGGVSSIRGAPYRALTSASEDPELLLTVPIAGAATIRGLCVVGGPSGRGPAKLRAFANRDDLDFASARESAALQEWELTADPLGKVEYPVKASKFSNVHTLVLHFVGTLGGLADGRGLADPYEDDESGPSEVRFLGLRGEFQERRREAVQAVYEARAIPKDHAVREEARGAGYGL